MIAGEPAAAGDPAEGPSDHPAPGLAGKPLLALIRLANLHESARAISGKHLNIFILHNRIDGADAPDDGSAAPAIQMHSREFR
ncbi:hypothetical protein FOHLNKBM_1111 [Methylobacterium longum]|nr:hypothetical protein FOHLNKBM_1111 [Methylobacterium longum]